MHVIQREPGGANNGDYHHHDYQGPYDSFMAAKLAGMEELVAEVNLAKRRLSEFRRVKRPAKKTD